LDNTALLPIAGAIDGGDADGHRAVAHPVAEALRRFGKPIDDGGVHA
jgi:hypothetical protein